MNDDALFLLVARNPNLTFSTFCDSPTGSPYLVITTYGLIQSSTLDFVSEVDDWDVVVLDEGQIIKNTSTKVSKACRRICESRDTRRIMLTGTPIQNNLKGD